MVTQSNPRLIICTPHDLYFASEIEVALNSHRKWGYTKNMIILVYEDNKEEKARYREYWVKLMERYSEVAFYFYENPNLKKLQNVYPQISRPWMLKTFWEQHPEMKTETFLYIDSDVLFTKPIDWSEMILGDTCYLSQTNYISAKYFESKADDILFHRKAEYATRDILGECCKIAGIDRQVVVDNDPFAGGCQYLLKNIDADFWEEVMKVCIELRLYLMDVNRQFFISEEKGFQSWCADMWAILWLLWKRGVKTECPEILDFSWACSTEEAYNKCAIYHNAGVSSKLQELDGKKHRMFYKADLRFRTSIMTFFDIKEWGDISKDYASYHYVEAIQDVQDPICVTENIYY